ncbi:hypothetical protein [Paraburkholderia phenoliruptrix]|uniref:hypothetical protein n=1 Tax=Paraburkholderia phenoliruptrix TaxID=252970 RepID=UPI0003FC4A66|nr:hypothetical protein [Paraburkholderia phenoliruptrix]
MPEREARAKLGGDFAYAIALGRAYCMRCVREARLADDIERYAAYQTAVRVALLIEWINGHYPPEPTLFNGDGTLTVATTVVDAGGRTFIEHDVIPATLHAARDLLGY